MSRKKSVSDFDGIMSSLSDMIRANGGRLGIAADINSADGARVLPSGFYQLDHRLLRIGGVPMGRLTHVFGPPSSCKSLLGYRLIARAQQLWPERRPLLIDSEGNSGPELDTWLRVQGVDVKSLIQSDVSLAEHAFDVACRLVETGNISILVLDSVGHLTTLSRTRGNVGRTKKLLNYGDKEQMGYFSKVIKEGVTELTNLANRTNTCLFFINQQRDNIGVLYGDRTTYPGGWCLKHAIQADIKMSKVGVIKDSKGRIEGVQVKATLKKSKVSPGGLSTIGDHLQFIFDRPDGDSLADMLIDRALRVNVIVGSAGSSWLKCPELNLKWHGKAKLASNLENDLELREEIERLVVDSGGSAVDDLEEDKRFVGEIIDMDEDIDDDEDDEADD